MMLCSVFVNCMVCSWFIVHQHPTICSWSYQRQVAFDSFSCKNCITVHTIVILVYIRQFLHCNLMYGGRSCQLISKVLSLAARFANESRKSTNIRRACCNLYQSQLKIWLCDHGLYHWFAWRNSKHALMVCCNKLGKLTHLIPTWVWGTQSSTSEVAKLFFASWVWYDGVTKWLAHNHDVHFTAIFWCVLWAMLGMQTLFSSAYHP